MSGTTTNLKLFKYNPNTDGDQTFNIDNALNNNFDKLDTVIGALANLTTTQKASLVNAINELVTNLGGKAAKDLSNLDSTGQAIIDAKIEAEALAAQNGYIKFKLNGISNSIILQWCYVTEAQYNGDYRNWPVSMSNCLFCSAEGGDYRYHTWIGGDSYITGTETHFQCGINADFTGAGWIKCYAVGLV